MFGSVLIVYHLVLLGISIDMRGNHRSLACHNYFVVFRDIGVLEGAHAIVDLGGVGSVVHGRHGNGLTLELGDSLMHSAFGIFEFKLFFFVCFSMLLGTSERNKGKYA